MQKKKAKINIRNIQNQIMSRRITISNILTNRSLQKSNQISISSLLASDTNTSTHNLLRQPNNIGFFNDLSLSPVSRQSGLRNKLSRCARNHIADPTRVTKESINHISRRMSVILVQKNESHFDCTHICFNLYEVSGKGVPVV